ncbi:MAG: BamA/OMP85 family outer membrane protein [Flavobacteriales bacterium]|tara:strand:+ start:12406 stop:14949 length:2544 start_codon:yes stop_codon:yes gene_type:complete
MNKIIQRFSVLVFVLLFSSTYVFSQDTITNNSIIDYAQPQDYIIGEIAISGVKHLSESVLINMSGLKSGEKITIPSDQISSAIYKLWNQGLFENIDIKIMSIVENKINLEIELEEYPRLSKFKFKGKISKSDISTLKEDLKLIRGKVLTQNLIINSTKSIKNFFIDKGFLNTSVKSIIIKDTLTKNASLLIFDINKNNKVKIHDIIVSGRKQELNTNKNLFNKQDTVYAISNSKLRKSMKETKVKNKWRFFKASKFIKSNYEEDKINIIKKYNEKGYRDARILKDTTFLNSDNSLVVEINLFEGDPYLFGNISFIGNTVYTNDELFNQMGIKKGDVFNQTTLESRLFGSQDGSDISALYLDNGYLFFNANPIEVSTENNQIDLEIRIYEGEQARVNKVSVIGNTKTNDHVIMREIRTMPGDLFKRSDIMRSQRELAMMQYFNPETFDVKIDPQPTRNEVDITYVVEEKSSDQISMSGGWGAGRVIGQLALTFNNFSSKNFFKKDKWKPLPSGDGQRLILQAQSNGIYYRTYRASFVEPWLGGKKPTSLSVSLHRAESTNGLDGDEKQELSITGLSVSLGNRLKKPDDWFRLYNGLEFSRYDLNNSQTFFSFSDGYSNNINYSLTLDRNSVDQATYPRQGSHFTLSLNATPPYSLFDDVDDYSTLTEQEKYKWMEFYKFNFKSVWYSAFTDKLVLATRTQFGLLGTYNQNKGITPFERFYVGGDGLSGVGMMNDGRELIALRGYSNNSLSPTTGATVFSKYTAELRYALSLNPSSTMYMLGFVEAGDAWESFDNFNPFIVKRTAGVGLRIMLPMVGMMGLDYGWGLDDVIGSPNANGGQFHFSMGQTF